MTGLIIRNAAGQITLDMTMSISQTMGYADTRSTNGSVTITAPPLGKVPFFVVIPLVDLQREKGKRPAVTLSGTTLSWAYAYAPDGWGYFSANCRIYYGYY